MTRYTDDFFLRQAGAVTASAARASLSTSTKAASGYYDVFLSHSVLDARIILGVRKWLESKGFRVYVDWIDDPLLDRKTVSAHTAHRLRKQMQRSRHLVYATSRAASKSRWMPWELGYFDGLHPGESVSMLAIEAESHQDFVGQEYLGLYPNLESLPALAGRGGAVTASGAQSLESLIRGSR